MERDFALPGLLRVEITHEDILEWVKLNAEKLAINPNRAVKTESKWTLSYDEHVAFESMLERIEDWFSMRNEVPLAVLAVRKLLNQIPVEDRDGEEEELPQPKKPRQRD